MNSARNTQETADVQTEIGATVSRARCVNKKVFADLSADELRQLEQQLKRIGRQAESMLKRRLAKRRSA
jgi:uncharacterized protein with von Willebrand factor type A (vWA) domain